MVGAEGEAFLAWHATEAGAKDGGRELLAWHARWRHEHESVPADRA